MSNVECADTPRGARPQTPLELAVEIHSSTQREKSTLSDNIRDKTSAHIKTLQNELSQLEQAMLILDDVARYKRRTLESMLQARQGIDDVASTPHEAPGGYLQAFAQRIASQRGAAAVPSTGSGGRHT